jgi:hypothetical protein
MSSFSRFPARRIVIGAVLATAWACANARTLYHTDFENFPVGSDKWVGTDGWIGNSTGTGSHGIDQDIIPGGGLGKTGFIGYRQPNQSFVYVANPIKYTPGAGDLDIVEIETLVGIEDSTIGNDNRDSFFVSVWDKAGVSLAGIRFSNDNDSYGIWREDGVGSTNTGVVFVRGELHLLFMRIDLAANTWSAELDGLPLFTDAQFNASGKHVEMGHLAYEWQLTSGNTMEYGDNWMLVADAVVRNWQQSGLFSYRTIGENVEIMDYPSTETGNVAIPDQIDGLPVTTIAESAFADCTGLTGVTIPASVTSIGNSAFAGCSALSSAMFLGDAPALGTDVFSGAAPSFSISYLAESSGFTTPTWNGYPASPVSEFDVHFAAWLSDHSLPADSSPGQDLNGDGVDLLMAYALNLDPNENLAGSMPAAVLASETLSISYYAASPGVSYTAETSTDLRSWTVEGVILSGTAENRRASVSRDSARRFLRLSVEETK